MGGFILLFNTTVANYRTIDSKLTLINSCYCDITPVQWQIFPWFISNKLNKACIQTLLYRKFRLNTLNTSVFTSSGGARGGEARVGKGGANAPPQNYFLPPHFAPSVLDNFCRNHTGRGATFVKNDQMLLKHMSWIGKIVKIYEMFLKNYIFGSSGKNFW